MATFSQEEVFTATEMVRNFSEILNKVNQNEIKKAVIVKNNRFQAVVLSMKEFERLEKAVELLNIVYSKKKEK